MSIDKLLNSKPNAIDFHDMTLASFEITNDYIFFRWGLCKDGVDCYEEFENIADNFDQSDTLLIDQVFYKPQIIDISLSSGLCAVDMEVSNNDYKDGVMFVLARDRVEKYLMLKFKFESFKTKLFKVVKDDQYVDNDYAYDIDYNVKEFSLEEFERRRIE